ncbi:MAG: Protein-export protein SecB [Gammaproteobacteria bacterium]|nr:Protein-export protein SecB [Gammaproteobacteria bacterium]
MAEEKKQRFELRKIYVKDLSFESPMAPNIFTMGGAPPAITVQLDVGHEALGNDMFESIVTVTVNGKVEEKDAFLVEVQQAGVFEISGIDPDKGLVAALEVACPNLLFPFAREVINDIVGKGGFPQLLLSPVHFESLYRHKIQSKANNARSEETTGENAGEAAAEKGADSTSS